MNRPNLSKTDIGEAARQMICARLLLHSIKVFRPMTEDTPVDLLILSSDGTVEKCQCKYLWKDGKSGCHRMNLYSVRKNGPGDKARKHVYTRDEIDFFLGYCSDNDAVYVIPISETNGRMELIFWITRNCRGHNDLKPFDHERYRENYGLLDPVAQTG